MLRSSIYTVTNYVTTWVYWNLSYDSATKVRWSLNPPHIAHCTVTENFWLFTKTVGIQMTLRVCLFAQSKLFLCRETQSLVHSLVIYTPRPSLSTDTISRITAHNHHSSGIDHRQSQSWGPSCWRWSLSCSWRGSTRSTVEEAVTGVCVDMTGTNLTPTPKTGKGQIHRAFFYKIKGNSFWLRGAYSDTSVGQSDFVNPK